MASASSASTNTQPFHVQEELERFQHLDGLFRQAAIEVVDEHHQPAPVADVARAHRLQSASKIVECGDPVLASACLGRFHDVNDPGEGRIILLDFAGLAERSDLRSCQTRTAGGCLQHVQAGQQRQVDP